MYAANVFEPCVATNQAVNFTAYQEIKDRLIQWQDLETLPSYQHLIAGGVSGAMGPLSNAPIDTIKTRIQRVFHFNQIMAISI
jgi:solute carrier family 25 citrate transporter 1